MTPAVAARGSERWERVVASELEKVFGEDLVCRTPRRDDGWLEGPVITAPDLWIECQHKRNGDPGSLLFAAERDAAASGLWPMVVQRDGYDAATVHMRFEHFIELLREWWSARLARRGDR